MKQVIMSSPSSHLNHSTEMDAFQQLKHDTRLLLKSHEASEYSLPFPTGELIVFALLDGAEDGSTKHEIISHILLRSSEHNQRVAAIYKRPSRSLEDCSIVRDGRAEIAIDPHFRRALEGWDMPITEEIIDGVILYKLVPSEARIYLNKYLDRPRKGIFRFLELPPELRCIIYTYLFSLSGKEGLTFTRPNALNRHIITSPYRANGSDSKRLNQRFRVPVRESISNLPFTSKVIYHEAMPFLTALNSLRFFCESKVFARVFNAMPIHMTQHFKDITFLHFTYYKPEPWPPGKCKCGIHRTEGISEAFKVLAATKTIRKFEIRDFGFERNIKTRLDKLQKNRKRLFAEFGKIELLKDIIGIASKAGRYKIEGYDGLTEYAQEEVERIKAAAKEQDVKDGREGEGSYEEKPAVRRSMRLAAKKES